MMKLPRVEYLRELPVKAVGPKAVNPDLVH